MVNLIAFGFMISKEEDLASEPGIRLDHSRVLLKYETDRESF